MKGCDEEGCEEQGQMHWWDHSTQVSLTLSAYQLLKDIKIRDQISQGGHTIFWIHIEKNYCYFWEDEIDDYEWWFWKFLKNLSNKQNGL